MPVGWGTQVRADGLGLLLPVSRGISRAADPAAGPPPCTSQTQLSKPFAHYYHDALRETPALIYEFSVLILSKQIIGLPPCERVFVALYEMTIS
jgi:hypothetical protein